MKILHVTPYYLPAVRYGGPVFSVSGLCQALAGCGHEVHVYTTSLDGSKNMGIPRGPVMCNGVSVNYFSSPIFRRYFWAPSLQTQLTKNIHQYDVIHLHTVYVWPVQTAAASAKQAKIPYLIAPRGMLERALIQKKSKLAKSAWIKFFGKKIISGADAVHVTTSREERELKKLGLGEKKTVLIPNGIDVAAVKRDLSSQRTNFQGEEYALFLSRINWKKGLDRLLEAWAKGVEIKLVIAGNDEEGYTRELNRLASKLGISEKIQFVGHVDGREKWDLFRNAKLFILPSYSENFGNVVLEAMTAGCPVLVTPEVGLSDAVKEHCAGAVVEGRPEVLADKIKTLLADEHLLEKMGMNGIEASQKHFSWSAIGKKMEQVYLEIVQS